MPATVAELPPTTDVFDALASTSAAVDTIASALPDWSLPTPAAGWTVGHQIAHLAWTDTASLLAITDAERFYAEAQEAAKAALTFVDDGAQQLLDHQGAGLAEHWRTGRRDLDAALRALDPGQQIPWYGPPMRPKTMATARLMETWAHGLDIADAAGVTLDTPEALPHVARIGVRTRNYAYLVNGQTAPEEEFRVELTAAGDIAFAAGPEDAAQRVSGPLIDFCRLVTQRVALSRTALVAVGPDAAHWLTIAQCFAGPPGKGRS